MYHHHHDDDDHTQDDDDYDHPFSFPVDESFLPFTNVTTSLGSSLAVSSIHLVPHLLLVLFTWFFTCC